VQFFKLKDVPKSVYGINLIYQPKNLCAFFVNLDLSTKLERHVGVMLPGLDEESMHVYDRWQASKKELEGESLSVKEFQFNPEVPFDPDKAQMIDDIWQGVYAE
jgi:hypothetical protein